MAKQQDPGANTKQEEFNGVPVVDNMNAEVWGEVIFENKPYYVLTDRQWVRLLDVNPMLIRMATRTIKLPTRPTYETKTMSGRTEKIPLDAEAAKDNPSDQAKWEVYLEEYDEANAERTDISTRAMLFYGTEFTPPDTGWEDKQAFIGIEVPTKPELRKVHYLSTEISLSDFRGLVNAIAKRMGVSEEQIAQAEDSF